MTAGYPLNIKNILIENYRPYQNLEIDLSQDREKNITIIEGNNSLGKTSLMNALHWCLYGDEPFWINDSDEGKPIPNKIKLNETNVGEKLETKVEINFSNYDKITHKIIRKLECIRKHDGKDKIRNVLAGGLIDVGFNVTESLLVEVLKDDGNWKIVDDKQSAQNEIERIIPNSLAEFVLFNGEMLATFFSPEKAGNILKGIEGVSGIEITNKVVKHWEQMENTFRKKARSYALNVDSEIRLRDNNQEKLDENLVQISKLNEKINELVPEQKRLEKILETHPEQLINELSSQREECKKLTTTLESNRQTILQTRIEYFQKNFSPLLLNTQILDAHSVILHAESLGVVPGPLDANHLREKIEDGFCICGIKLEDHPIQKQNLMNLITDIKSSVLKDIASEGRNTIPRLLELPNSEEILKQLNLFRERYNAALKAIQTNYDKIAGIASELEKYPAEKIRILGGQLRELDKKINDYRTEIIKLEQKCEGLKNFIASKDKIIDAASKKSLDSQRWQKKAEIAKKAKEVMTQMREEILIDIKNTVQQRTQKLWQNLIARGEEVLNVEITDDFKIKVIDEDNVDGLRDLSAGQTLYLALSFITAVRDVTDINYPMIIDSPFGKVSGHERVKAADDLPNYLPQTQITFLVTNTEYNSTVYDSGTKKEYPPISEKLKSNEKLWKEFVLILEKITPTTSVTRMEAVDN